MEPYDYPCGDRTLHGAVIAPVGVPRAGIVLFPTIMNRQPNVERRMPMLADAGYLVMIADLYGEIPRSREEAHTLGTELRRDVAHYRKVIRAAVDGLAAHPAAEGLALGAVGYCLGGQAAVEAARMDLPLRAVTSFHGLLTTGAPATAPLRPRILVCHGDKDPMVPREQVLAFEEEMDRAGADWHLHVYARARHGFTDPQADSHNLPALGYDQSADRQSWSAMLSLFDEVFD